MDAWGARWRRARRYGLGQAWRAALAYRMHDAVIEGRRVSDWSGRAFGFGQHPQVLPTAIPGVSPGWDLEECGPGDVLPLPRQLAWVDTGRGAAPVTLPALPPVATLGVRRLRVRDAVVSPGQSLVVTAEAALVPELMDRVVVGPGLWEPGPATCVSPWRKRRPAQEVGDEGERRMHRATVTLWRAGDARESLPVGISLFETVDDHFGHGMLDLLHRLRAVHDVPLDWPLLVSDAMPATVIAWMHLLCPGRRVIRCRPGRVLAVRELLVPLEAARLWQRPRIGDVDGPSPTGEVPPSRRTAPATIDPSGMRWLQEVGALVSRRGHRRLWIRRDRSPHSAILGEAELVDVARRRGFEDVFLQDLTFEQVRDLMSQASHVIAPMASAVANTVLARPGLSVLQLTDEISVLDRYGSLLWLPTIGHRSGLIAGRTDSRGYRVTPAALNEGLDWLLSAS